MFFEKKVNFRLKEEHIKEANDFVKNNPEIENFSHLCRIALFQYIRTYGNKPETVLESHKDGQTHKDYIVGDILEKKDNERD